MAGRSSISRLAGRRLWFSIHKWIGLLFLIVLIPLSASGSLLVWHDWTDSLVNPQRYAIIDGTPRLGADEYIRSAKSVLPPGDRIASVEWPKHGAGPVVVSASPAPSGTRQAGPPARTQVWLDPADARVLDRADSRGGLLRTLHAFHGSLMIPGAGRTIVGWLGVLMLISCLSGLWLWWPSTGRLVRALRWKRGPLISGNLHHQVGFWAALPLAILSFTGAYISFPSFFRGIESFFVPEKESRGPVGPPDRRALPAAVTVLEPDAALALARQGGKAAPLTLRWPSEKSGEWSVTLAGERGVQAVTVDDETGMVKPSRGPGGAARFMRELHDGGGYNWIWQTIIFVGGLAPTLLGITGLIMWLRTRVWRNAVDRRQRAKRVAGGALR